MTTRARLPIRRAASALAAGAILTAIAAGCAAQSRDDQVVKATVDTFVTSSRPTSQRGNETFLLVMNSPTKSKLAYVGFPVKSTDTAFATGTLKIWTKYAGFDLTVYNSAPFTSSTVFNTRPGLYNQAGKLAKSKADTRHDIPLTNVRIVDGYAYFAISTTNQYEQVLMSAEGATNANKPDLAPTFALDGVDGNPPPTTAPPTTAPPTTAPPTTAPPTTAPPTTRPPGNPPPTTTPPGTEPGDWRQVFGDEFNGSSVDTSKWHVYDQSNGDSVESPKASTCPQASNVSVSGGVLTMRTQRANGSCSNGQAHSGAGMSTSGGFKQAGGRFEARLRWTAKGNYLWGGFWTHGNITKSWVKQDSAEIDILEYIGKDSEPNINRFKPAIHYNYTCEGSCGYQSMQYHPIDITQWHTYAIEWEPTKPSDPTTMQIRFYVDGNLITVFDKNGMWRVSSTGAKVLELIGGWLNPGGAFPNPFTLDRPHILILSAWVGAPGVSASTVAAGYNPPGGRADLLVDYVRTFQRD